MIIPTQVQVYSIVPWIVMGYGLTQEKKKLDMADMF